MHLFVCSFCVCVIVLCFFIHLCTVFSVSTRSILQAQESILCPSSHLGPLKPRNPSWLLRNVSHGNVNLVISDGKPKFETHEVDPPKKEKWMTKKRLKLKRKREKQKRKAANKKDPRRLTVKGKKQKFANAEERIKYKLEKVSVFLEKLYLV